MNKANDVIEALRSKSDEKQRRILMKFFKTGKGEYGEGDKFLGLKVPQVRSVVAECNEMGLDEIYRLLQSEWHDARLCGLLVLVARFGKLCSKRLIDNEEAMKERDKIVEFYIANAESRIIFSMAACYNLARILLRKSESADDFTPEQNAAIEKMMRLTDNAMKQMLETICGRREEVSIAPTRDIEQKINDLRDELKLQNTTDVNSRKYGFAIGTMFIDVISECEKLGDYVVNVVEARLGKDAQ